MGPLVLWMPPLAHTEYRRECPCLQCSVQHWSTKVAVFVGISCLYNLFSQTFNKNTTEGWKRSSVVCQFMQCPVADNCHNLPFFPSQPRLRRFPCTNLVLILDLRYQTLLLSCKTLLAFMLAVCRVWGRFSCGTKKLLMKALHPTSHTVHLQTWLWSLIWTSENNLISLSSAPCESWDDPNPLNMLCCLTHFTIS